MPNNRERADRGFDILNRYGEEWDRGEELPTVLTDLIADLMHAVRSTNPRKWRKLWDAAIALADNHHEAERVQGWDRETHA